MILIKRLRASLARFQLGYKPGDLVLDVGSGNNPHPRADLLCDQFIFDDAERGNQLIADRPLVGGDIERLPFRDQSIDFLVASHILEHVRDPARTVKELCRVARRGYIETPAEFGGKLLDMPFHRWFVRQEGRTLVFTGKPKAMYDDYLNHVSYDLWHNAKDLRRLYWNHLDLFLVRFRWEGDIAVTVIEPAEGMFEELQAVHAGLGGDVATKAPNRSVGARLKAGLHGYYRSGLYGPKRPVDLAAICACPACHGPLAFAESTAICGPCGLSYPIAKAQGLAVPMLLESQASRA